MTQQVEHTGPVLMSREAALKGIRERGRDISWYKIKSAKACPLSLVAGSFMSPFYATKPQAPNDTAAVAGSIVQRVMEIFVNSQIYARPQYRSMGDLYNWCSMATAQLVELTVHERSFWDALLSKGGEVRTYFQKGKEGMAKIDSLIAQGLLMPEFKWSNKLQIVDPSSFSEKWGNKQNLVKELSNLYPEILRSFAKHPVLLRNTKSEIWFTTELDGFNLKGSVDFIENQNASFDPRTLEGLGNGMRVFDGKFNVNNFTDPEQMQFYAASLKIRTRKMVDSMAFINWGRGCFEEPIPVDTTYLDRLRGYLSVFDAVNKDLEKALSKMDAAAIPVEAFITKNTPGLPSRSNCTFCPISETCPARKDWLAAQQAPSSAVHNQDSIQVTTL